MSLDVMRRTASGQHATPPSGQAWGALMVVESRRMLLHPAVLVSFLLAVAPWIISSVTNPSATAFPDLTSASWTVQYPMLIVGAGTFVAAYLAAARRHHCRVAEFEEVLSLPHWQRTAALCAAVTGPAVLGLAVSAVRLGVQSAQPGAAGAIHVGELLTVAALILLAGVLGVLVASLVPHIAIGFVTLMVLVILGVVGIAVTSSRARWLSFVAGENPFDTPPLPRDLIHRPAWWHLLWLTALTAVAVTAALRRTGLRTKVLTGATVAAVLLAGTAAVMQLRPPPADLGARLEIAHTAPSRVQVCERRDGVTYCAFPDFRSRIDAWARVVEGQLALVPVTTPPLAVRQHLPLATDAQGFPAPLPLEVWAADDATAGIPRALPVSTRWSAGGADSFDETDVIGFSALVASVLVTGDELSPGGFTMCGGPGAVALWLAASATPDIQRALRTVLSHTSGGGVGFPILNSQDGVWFGQREVEFALMMLDADQEAVRSRVIAHWETLTAEATDVDHAAAILGQQPPPRLSRLEAGLCA